MSVYRRRSVCDSCRIARRRLKWARLARERRNRDREAYNNQMRQWRAANRRAWQKRRAIQRMVRCDCISLEEIAERDNNKCGICGRYVPIKERSLDHIIPIALGGSHTFENVQLAHLSCNKSRGLARKPAQLRLPISV